MNPLPTFSQIQDVKHLHSTDLFGPASIVRMTGVPLRDVFRIIRSLDAILVAADGTILDGHHRLIANRKS